MVGRLYGMRRARGDARARELLERFDLDEAADRPAKTYSGGMRRRLDLAAALVAKPPVLFLDEPTTGLDPRSRLELWKTIEELVAEGATVLLTTQYLDEADRLADAIAVIDHGRVIAQGTPDELKDRVGGERLEVRLSSRRAGPGRGARADADRRRAAALRGRHRHGRRAPAQRRDRRGGAPARRGRRRASTTSRCGARRSTTCSSRSPATPPRRPDDDAAEEPMSRVVTDTLIVAERNLVRLTRAPDLLLAFTVQPIMFVLLFVYVFGGAILVPDFYDSYAAFLLPGIIVQNIAFGGFVTALGLNEDLTRG